MSSNLSISWHLKPALMKNSTGVERTIDHFGDERGTGAIVRDKLQTCIIFRKGIR